MAWSISSSSMPLRSTAAIEVITRVLTRRVVRPAELGALVAACGPGWRDVVA
jgi:hypothetical protein